MTENVTAAEVLRHAANDELQAMNGKTYKADPLIKIIQLVDPAVTDADVPKSDYMRSAFARIALNRLANMVDAEIEAARAESLRQEAELWAKANGRSEFKEGEDFGAWLDRCTLPRLRFEDGEPVQFGDNTEYGELKGVAYWGENAGPDAGIISLETVENGSVNVYAKDRIKRADPETLDADGVPIHVDDTVWAICNGKKYKVTGIGRRTVRIQREGEVCAYFPTALTHKEPDTQAKIDADARLLFAAEYWNCDSRDCNDCPALINGKKPEGYYKVDCCATATTFDLLRRQRELDARTMGGEEA